MGGDGSTAAERRQAREEAAQLSILTARHQWEHGEISKREFQYREDMWLRSLKEANDSDPD